MNDAGVRAKEDTGHRNSKTDGILSPTRGARKNLVRSNEVFFNDVCLSANDDANANDDGFA